MCLLTLDSTFLERPLMILLGAQLPKAKLVYFCLPFEALLTLLAYDCSSTSNGKSKESKQNKECFLEER